MYHVDILDNLKQAHPVEIPFVLELWGNQASDVGMKNSRDIQFLGNVCFYHDIRQNVLVFLLNAGCVSVELPDRSMEAKLDKLSRDDGQLYGPLQIAKDIDQHWSEIEDPAAAPQHVKAASLRDRRRSNHCLQST